MNYGYNGYTSYGWQPQENQRQQYMYPAQMPGASNNNDERIWVNGEGQARDYLITPNGFVRLWDSQEPVFYEKRADASGRPVLETYEYHKVDSITNPKTATNGFNAEKLAEEIESLKRRILALERGENYDEQ